MIDFIKYTFQFLVLVLLQVLVLNNIQLMGYMNPYLYVLFILMLPADINRNLLLIIGFGLGLLIDVFENSGGIHASATALLAFVRPALFKMVAGPASGELRRLNVQTIGAARFMSLAAIAVFLHHLWLFSLEAFRFSEWWQVLSRTILSGIFTLILIYLAQFLVYRKAE